MMDIHSIDPTMLIQCIQAVALSQPERQASWRGIDNGRNRTIPCVVFCWRVSYTSAPTTIVDRVALLCHSHIGIQVGQGKEPTGNRNEEWISRIQAEEVDAWSALY